MENLALYEVPADSQHATKIGLLEKSLVIVRLVMFHFLVESNELFADLFALGVVFVVRASRTISRSDTEITEKILVVTQ